MEQNQDGDALVHMGAANFFDILPQSIAPSGDVLFRRAWAVKPEYLATTDVSTGLGTRITIHLEGDYFIEWEVLPKSTCNFGLFLNGKHISGYRALPPDENMILREQTAVHIGPEDTLILRNIGEDTAELDNRLGMSASIIICTR